MATYHFSTPLQEEDMRKLHVGDVVYLTGHVFTARDMAHLRIRGLLEEGKPLPKDFAGAAVFHAGPVALKNEDGSWRLNVIGPTTSIRMEPYADVVGRMGVRAVIGKGGMDVDTLRPAASTDTCTSRRPPAARPSWPRALSALTM